MSSRSGGLSFPRQQAGAAMVYAAFFMMVLIAAATLSIDIGRMYNAQRDLQRAANLAALDAAAISGGCYGNQQGQLSSDPLGLAQTEAAASLVRNGVPSEYLSGADAVQIGKLTSQNGVRSFRVLESGEDPNARSGVQITLRRTPPNRLLPLSAGGQMVARAAADSRPRVTIGVASSTANIDLLRGIFNNFGGSPVGLTAVGYQGLLTSYVRLGDLAANLGVGSVDDLLSANTTVGLDDLINALGQGQTGSVATLLHQLAGAAGSAPNVGLGQIINAPLGLGESGADAVVNVGQILTAAAEASNGTNLISLPINLNLGPAVTATASLRLIEPAQTAVIRAGVLPTSGSQTSYGENSYASTAQGALQIHVKTHLGITGVLGVDLDVPLYLEIAKATASLDEVRCAHRGQPEHEVDLLAQASIAGIGLGTFDDLNAPNPQPTASSFQLASIDVLGVLLKPLLGGKLLTLYTSPIQAPIASQTKTLEFDGPFATPLQGFNTSVGTSTASALTNLSASNLTACLGACGGSINVLLNGVISSAKSLVLTSLSSILGALDSALAPILDALGIDLGNAQFQVVSLDPVNSTESDPTANQQLSLQAFLFNH